MDANSFFWKISAGAKFNLKRFNEDAKKLKIIPDQNNKKEDLNYFTSIDKGKSNVKNVPRNQCSKLNESSENFLLLGKRRNNHDEPETRPKGKKTRKRLAELKQEEVNHFRNKRKIHVWGPDVPDPVGTFEDLQKAYGIYPDIIDCVKNVGYTFPTPIQMQAIPIMLERREILACAPTGSGKTAAFLIPIVQHLKEPRKSGFRAVIVSPTRELAKQTYRECERLCQGRELKVHIINKVNEAIRKFGLGSALKCDILVTTPNRLVYLLNQEPPAVNLKNVEWLIIDESDKLFEAGRQGFRDQLGVIYKACDSANVRRAMFSATFAYEVEEWCKLNLDNVVTVSIGARNTAVDLVKQELLFVGNELGKLIAFRDIIKKGLSPPMLVFVQTKERAKELFNELIYDGINVDVIHSERTQLQRDNVVKCFRLGKIWVLICTELMGRGIDFKGVNVVVNYDFPPSAISYIHRIGRTGRAGRLGQAVTFFTEDDVTNLRSVAQVMRNAGCDVPEYMLKLRKPNKKVKKNLLKSAPKREKISTIPKYDLEKEAERKKMIQKSKEKKKKKLKAKAVEM